METNNVIKKLIYKNTGKFMLLFSVLSLTSVTTFWWLSIFSLIFYTWNFFNEKEYLRLTITFFFLTILLIVFNFSVIKPTKDWAEKARAKWDKTGIDSTFIPGAQLNLNVIARSVEEYKSKYGTYPNQLSEIQNISMNLLNNDVSYRLKDTDGQTRPIMFYYEKINSNKYYLAGVGRDGKIKTNDDLLPQISLEQKNSTGLLKYVVKSFSEEEIKEENGVMIMFKRSRVIENMDKNK
ncbi:MAG TPA: hypothetical protein VI413_00985 [Paludibacter sp.]